MLLVSRFVCLAPIADVTLPVASAIQSNGTILSYFEALALANRKILHRKEIVQHVANSKKWHFLICKPEQCWTITMRTIEVRSIRMSRVYLFLDIAALSYPATSTDMPLKVDTFSKVTSSKSLSHNH